MQKASILYAFEAGGNEELNVKKGDVVLIVEEETEDSGWTLVQHELTGAQGFVPTSYLKIKPSAPPIPTKSRSATIVVSSQSHAVESISSSTSSTSSNAKSSSTSTSTSTSTSKTTTSSSSSPIHSDLKSHQIPVTTATAAAAQNKESTTDSPTKTRSQDSTDAPKDRAATKTTPLHIPQNSQDDSTKDRGVSPSSFSRPKPASTSTTTTTSSSSSAPSSPIVTSPAPSAAAAAASSSSSSSATTATTPAPTTSTADKPPSSVIIPSGPSVSELRKSLKIWPPPVTGSPSPIQSPAARESKDHFGATPNAAAQQQQQQQTTKSTLPIGSRPSDIKAGHARLPSEESSLDSDNRRKLIEKLEGVYGGSSPGPFLRQDPEGTKKPKKLSDSNPDIAALQNDIAKSLKSQRDKPAAAAPEPSPAVVEQQEVPPEIPDRKHRKQGGGGGTGGGLTKMIRQSIRFGVSQREKDLPPISQLIADADARERKQRGGDPPSPTEDDIPPALSRDEKKPADLSFKRKNTVLMSPMLELRDKANKDAAEEESPPAAAAIPKPSRPKPTMSEDRASEILSRSIRNWYRLKRFRDYVQKDPSLKDGRIRNNIVRDIIATERTYVNGLNTIVSVFLRPLQQKKKLADQGITEKVFSNVEQILDINKLLLDDLNNAMKDWPRCRIGQVFAKMCPFLKVYTTYINNFDEATSLLESNMEKRTKFGNFVMQCAESPECGGLDLQAFLIMPVQRIPRYKLLLSDILSKTRTDHIEYNDLKAALDSISALASFVNERKRQNDNTAVLIQMQNLLKSKFNNFIQPHRQFVREGRLNMACIPRNIAPQWHKTFLFNDCLIFLNHTDPTKLEEIEFTIVYFIFTRVVPQKDGRPGASKVFQLDSYQSNGRTTFTIMANSPDDRAVWEKDIGDCITAILKAKNQLMFELDKYEEMRDKLGKMVPIFKKEISALQMDSNVMKQKVQRLAASISDNRDKAQKLSKLIEKESGDKEHLDVALIQMQSQEANIIAELEDKEQELRECDVILCAALNHDYDSFRYLFNEMPTAKYWDQIDTRKLAPGGVTQDSSQQPAQTPGQITIANAAEEPRGYKLNFKKLVAESKAAKDTPAPAEQQQQQPPQQSTPVALRQQQQAEINSSEPDEEVEETNPLFLVRPPNQLLVFEQEDLICKYFDDRQTHGEEARMEISEMYDSFYDEQEEAGIEWRPFVAPPPRSSKKHSAEELKNKWEEDVLAGDDIEALRKLAHALRNERKELRAQLTKSPQTLKK